MDKVQVLVVDDSAFMRVTITDLIQRHPDLMVIGTARNGVDAVRKVQKLRPQVVTMDVDMPELDGVSAVREIMKECPVPIVMLSARTDEGAQVTLDALEAGAVDFFVKMDILGQAVEEAAVQDFHQRLIAAAHTTPTATIVQKPVPRTFNGPALNSGIELVVIGCSTGGPAALNAILPFIPANFPVPVVVLQHMPPGFTRPLAERLNNQCELRVKEAEDGEPILPGNIYIAPSGTQCLIRQSLGGKPVFMLSQESPVETRYRPSVDVTLLSAVPLYKERMLAVILTGMGHDGLRGCTLLKEHRGRILSEAEESCVVYGMPKSVYEAGLVDQSAPIQEMAARIIASVGLKE